MRGASSPSGMRPDEPVQAHSPKTPASVSDAASMSPASSSTPGQGGGRHRTLIVREIETDLIAPVDDAGIVSHVTWRQATRNIEVVVAAVGSAEQIGRTGFAPVDVRVDERPIDEHVRGRIDCGGRIGVGSIVQVARFAVDPYSGC